MVREYKIIFDEDDAEFYANRARIESLESGGFSVERHLVEEYDKKIKKFKSVEINLGQDLPVNW